MKSVQFIGILTMGSSSENSLSSKKVDSRLMLRFSISMFIPHHLLDLFVQLFSQCTHKKGEYFPNRQDIYLKVGLKIQPMRYLRRPNIVFEMILQLKIFLPQRLADLAI
jgi:hypothetical protein